MGWRQEIANGIFYACCAAFNLNPEAQEGLSRFVPAYTENEITPQAPRDVDVCYFSIGQYQGESNLDYIMLKQANVNGQTKTRITKTVPCSVLLTFYGPNADDDSEFFWSAFQWDNGVNSPRSILRKRKIVPIGKPDRPVSLYEVEGTYQRRRCDVRVNLAYLDVGEKNSSYIDTVPDTGIRFQT